MSIRVSALVLCFAVTACSARESGADVDPLGDVVFVPWESSAEGGFFLGLTEVTNNAFGEFLRATRYRRDDPAFLLHWPATAEGVKTVPTAFASHPVVHVNMEDARAFARWKGMRLPSAREWDWAAGFGVNGGFTFGLWRPLRANTLELGLDHTTPVGLFENGRSFLGLYDLAGNVNELTEGESAPVLRGESYLQWLQRVDYSGRVEIVSDEYSAQDAGFRVAADGVALLETRVLRGPASSTVKIQGLARLLRQGGPPARALVETFAAKNSGARAVVSAAILSLTR